MNNTTECFLQNRDDNIAKPNHDNSSHFFIEFIIYLLPNYLFILAYLYRHRQIKHLKNKNQSPKIWPIKTLRIAALIYMVIFGLSFILGVTNNDAYQDGPLSILYIFGCVSWYLSIKLTESEYEKAIFPHRFYQPSFWVASLFTLILKTIVEEKFTFFTAVLDLLQLFTNVFALFSYHNYKKYNENYQVVSEYRSLRSEFSERLLDSMELHAIPKSLGATEDFSKPFPLLEIKIADHVEKEYLSKNATKHIFTVTVTNNNKFYHQVTRSLSEFVYLEKELKIIYTYSKFPVLSSFLPTLNYEDIELFLSGEPEYTQINLIQQLQDFLNEIVQSPGLMHNFVLDFLDIEGSLKVKYINYFEKIEPGRNIRQLLTKRSSSFTMAVDIRNRVLDIRAMEILDLRKLQSTHLQVQKKKFYYSEAKHEILYVFQIEEVADDDLLRKSWNIRKSYAQFCLNHQKMQEQLFIKLPELESFVCKPFDNENDTNPEYLQQTLGGLEKYLKTILSMRKLLCTSLFEFLGLDPITFMTNEIRSEYDLSFNEED